MKSDNYIIVSTLLGCTYFLTAVAFLISGNFRQDLYGFIVTWFAGVAFLILSYFTINRGIEYEKRRIRIDHRISELKKELEDHEKKKPSIA